MDSYNDPKSKLDAGSLLGLRMLIAGLLGFSVFWGASSIASAEPEVPGTVPRQVTKPLYIKPPADLSSSNFGKTQKFLPGEEVVTPTGKTIKVWSTEGPVPVSPPPQPFDHPEKSIAPQVGVVIDGRSGAPSQDGTASPRSQQAPN